MQDLQYTLIIPHFDIPDLLERCLRSVPEREDLEVIVVDDNSPEKSKEALRHLEREFPHMTFIYCESNGGAGKARNIGMEKAAGRYLIFADADDFFTDQLADALDDYQHATEDVIYFRNISVLSDSPEQMTDRTTWIDNKFENYFRTGDERELRSTIFNPWAKFFRREHVFSCGVKFDEVPYSNDIFFVVSAGCKAKTIKADVRRIYAYTERQGSLTSAFNLKPGELAIRSEACFKAQKIMKEAGISFHFMPMTDYLSRMLHTDRKLYRKYIRKSGEIYQSVSDAIRQVRWWETGWGWKLWTYIYSAYCLMF